MALTVLQAIAFELHQRQRRDDMTFAQFAGWSMPILDRYNARRDRPVSPGELLCWLRQRVGLVIEYAEGRYGFAHLGIQEYLAARSIGNRRDKALAELAGRLEDEWWREVTLLLLGEAPHDEVFVPFVHALLKTPDWHQHHAWLSTCLAEAINGSSSPFLATLLDPSTDPRARETILKLFKDRRDEAIADAAQQMLGEAGLDGALADLVQQTLVLAGRRQTEDIRTPEQEDGEPRAAVAAAPMPSDDRTRVLEHVGTPSSNPALPVFMSHSGHDKVAVRRLTEALREAGLRTWLDEDEIVPGQPWMPALEQALERSAVVLVAVGPSGLGQWQTQEMYVAIGMAVRRGRRVVPVLLPDLPPGDVELPLMLQGHSWVDLREDPERGLQRLIESLRSGPAIVERSSSREPARFDETSTPSRTPEGEPWVEPTTGIRLLWVPGGRFTMGSGPDDPGAYDDERPAHQVELRGFWLGETPVTNRQYSEFLRATPHATEPRLWRDRRFSAEQQPVVGVSWQDAQRFCTWLMEITGEPIRLPTEAQWEYAARGTDGRRYPWGNETPDVTRACFGLDWDKDHPPLVGQFPHGRGPFGHLDQAGTVWDWCRDTWDEAAYGRREVWAQLDPVVEDEGVDRRVCRGGAWGNPARSLRASCRVFVQADAWVRGLGFRVCRPSR
ncbi:MAG: SUMF1/EgtB/PvdO family nonheme iron enzyme [Myxococcales bacterium]|nr:SUMF1/EgtB/PvdO family nonheme iron enzyme [Myxococcales bacterium]